MGLKRINATRLGLAAALAIHAPLAASQGTVAPKVKVVPATRPAVSQAAPTSRAPSVPGPSSNGAPGACERVNIAPIVNISVGKSTVLRPPAPVARILLGNPDNVRAARPAEPGTRKDQDDGGRSAG